MSEQLNRLAVRLKNLEGSTPTAKVILSKASEVASEIANIYEIDPFYNVENKKKVIRSARELSVALADGTTHEYREAAKLLEAIAKVAEAINAGIP